MSSGFTNLKQIGSYPPADAARTTDVLLLQQGGLGGPYASILAPNLFRFAPGTPIGWNAAQLNSDGIAITCNGTFGALKLLENGDRVATIGHVVESFNGRACHVVLETDDILRAGGAPQVDAHFCGWITAPSPWDPRLDDDTVATTRWSQRAMCAFLEHWLEIQPLVFTFMGRSGNVILTTADVNQAFATVDGTFPMAPTPALGDASNRIATTLFVDESLSDLHTTITNEWTAADNAIYASLAGNYAPLDSPVFTGIPQAPTPAPGTSTGQLATTSFVMNAITAGTAGVSSFNTRTGSVTLTAADVTGVGGALLVSPIFTGTPSAPTAAPGNSSTQLATTAFVTNAISASTAGVASFNGRTGTVTLTLADITAAGGAPLADPGFTGVPTAPTATAGTSSTQLATTAFVMNAVSAGTAGVSSFNSRTGSVTLNSTDVSAAGGALLASPTFTGTPSGPTATAGTSTTQLATTAFVAAAVAAATAGVSSFNTRTGAVVLTTADITGAGGAPIASPTFTGVPAGPTAAPGNSTTQLATTAFVTAAVAASVTSFNGRTGAVTLTSADISSAGGAPLASPTFTGTPAAPTATAGTSTTQIATTAFVMNAIAASGGPSPATSTPLMDGTAAVGTSLLYARQDHVHPTDTSRAAAASANLTGTPTAPTATAGTSTTQIATTAFVMSAIRQPATVAPLMDGTAAVGTSLLYARQDHVHPTDTSLLPLTGGTLTGNLTVRGGAPYPTIYLNSPTTGNALQVIGQINGVNRWVMKLGNGVTESGGNAGSDFQLINYSDAGAIIGAALGVNRANGNLSITGTAYMPGGGPWQATSDARIKTVLGNYTRGLSDIVNLNPVYYLYKGNDTPLKPDGDGPSYLESNHHAVAAASVWFTGLVAQDVEQAMPELVTKRAGWIDGHEVSDLRDLNTGPIMFALINAVKELAQRVIALEACLPAKA